MAKLSKEEMENLFKEKMAAIPTARINVANKQSLLDKNRMNDQKNFQNTVKILHDRKNEAIETGDQKKKYAAISVEHDQRDQFNVRNRLSELQKKFNFLKNTIPEEDWLILEPLVENSQEMVIQGDFSEKDLHLYFKDEFQIRPKYITKLIDLIKIHQDIICISIIVIVDVLGTDILLKWYMLKRKKQI
jgi:hypothetical protein